MDIRGVLYARGVRGKRGTRGHGRELAHGNGALSRRHARGDILDFYENGDVAPEGRYKYSLSVCDAPTGGEETEVETDAQTTQKPIENDYMGADNKGVGAVPIIAAAAAVAAVAGVVIAVLIKKKKK